jgi:two-component system, chemotaxis family, protein-glutamate methylesterase/glutaminase
VTTTRPALVVVGASLGGLYAVRTLVEGLPADFPLPVVLAQHRRPDADSRLAELLADSCPFPVIEPEDKEKLEGGRLYLAPANYHVMVERETLWLTVDAPVWFSRPSIDVLFESAAEAFGAATIGVVLTGSNEDGAAGSRAIKRAGGVLLVQDPATCESPVASRSAMAATTVDAVLPVPDLARRLVQLGMSGHRSAQGAQRET